MPQRADPSPAARLPRSPPSLLHIAGELWSRPNARHELAWMVGLLLAVLALLAFWHLAGEVAEGETRAFDRSVLLALRTPGDLAQPIGPHWLSEVARDITALGGNTVLTGVTLGVAFYLALAGRRAGALLVLCSVGGGAALSTALKLGFDRPRPDLVPHGVDVYLASFPSGHAMLSAVTYLTLGAILARVQPGWTLRLYVLALAALVSLLVGLSRVYLGVHWPTDVLGGWSAGAGWALLCWLVALWLEHAGWLRQDGRVEPSDPAPPDASRP